MGKASRFFRSLLGFKTPDPTSIPNKQPKRRWSFVRSHRDKPHHHRHLRHDFDSNGDGNDESSKHAFAVAAATAAVAEAAVAAAEAAAEVVRMTSRVGSAASASAGGYGFRAEWAAVKIQSYFRAYLARQALRALRGLVRLQALVRGDIQRRHNDHMMRRLQVLLRAQARALECRAKDHLHGPQTPEKFEHVVRARSIKFEQPSMLKKNSSRSFVQGVTTQTDHERHDKILEIDTVDPRHLKRNLFQPNPTSHSNSQSGSTIPPPGLSPTTSCEVNSKTAPFGVDDGGEEVSFCTAHNSSLEPGPGPFTTPAKSEGSRSCLSHYSDHHPNYMAYTESSRAKVRSLSAPKQRPPIEFPTKRHLVYGPGPGTQRALTLRDFASKAYPGSGRLDRLGMPVGRRESEGIGFYWN